MINSWNLENLKYEDDLSANLYLLYMPIEDPIAPIDKIAW